MRYLFLLEQVIRIIGGKYRGKKISFPNIANLRPTPNRVRETLFNWLMNDIRNARCLDAFAGSGALGIEALSRGAKSVTLIEKNPIIFQNLKKVCASLSNEVINLINDDANKYLTDIAPKIPEQFDIVFLDPPFKDSCPYACIDYLYNSDLLVNNGLLYLEFGQKITLDVNKWDLLKLKKSGQVIYTLYKKKVP